MLLKYSHVPVMVPTRAANFSRFRSVPQNGIPSFLVQADNTGYSATCAALTEAPPWRSEQPYFLGNRTALSISGSVAEPGPASVWCGIPVGSSLVHLPGLPISLRAGAKGYLTFDRNLTGNGGSDTIVRWRTRNDLYEVCVPLAPGDGGRSIATDIARHMTVLTRQGIGQLIERPVTIPLITQDAHGSTVAYTENVHMQLHLASLPARIPHPLVNPPGSLDGPKPKIHGSGSMRGFAYTYQTTGGRVLPPQVEQLHVTSVSGNSARGGQVTIEGTSSLPLPSSVEMNAEWNLKHGAYRFQDLKIIPDSIGTDKTVGGFSQLEDLRLSSGGRKFSAKMTVPRAVFAPHGRDFNRFAVLRSGQYSLTLSVWNASWLNPPQPSTFAITIRKGKVPWQPVDGNGPYSVTPKEDNVLPPLTATALAYLGVEGQAMGVGPFGVSSPVPVYLPAWVPSRLAMDTVKANDLPEAVVLPFAHGYLAVVLKDRVRMEVNPQLTWSQVLPKAQFIVYGSSAPPSVFLTAMKRRGQPSVSMPIGSSRGLETPLSSGGALVQVNIHGTQYGVYDVNASRTEVLRMTRSLTELAEGYNFIPQNVVKGYVQLIRSAKQDAVDDAGANRYGGLWASPTLWQEPAEDVKVDKQFLSWQRLAVHVQSLQQTLSGYRLKVTFTGMKVSGGRNVLVQRHATVDILATGQLAAITFH